MASQSNSRMGTARGTMSRAASKSSSSSGMNQQEFFKNSLTFKNQNGNIVHILNEFDLKLKELDDDIKALQKAKKEYGDQLKLLQGRKTDLESRVRENQQWAANFDGLIGPFERKYEDLKGTISGLYDIAKDKHTMGLKLLVENFDYHPEFKRWNDTFTSAPFRPK